MYWKEISQRILVAPAPLAAPAGRRLKTESLVVPLAIRNRSVFFKAQRGKEPDVRLRCTSVYGSDFGGRSAKQVKTHHLRIELPMHRKERMAQLIILNLSNVPV